MARHHRRFVPWLGLAAAVAASLAAQRPEPDLPAFRGRIDLIAVDVQVVDRNGTPIVGLTADKFEVLVDGKRRKVVSADLITFDRKPTATPPAPSTPQAPPGAPSSTGATQPAPVPRDPRLFVLAVDGMSFKPAEGHAIVRTVDGFLNQLQPDDRIGLVEFPTGPTVDPTTDRAAIRKALDVLIGLRSPLGRVSRLRPSEADDIAQLYAGCPNRVEFLKPIFAAACDSQIDCGCIVPLASDAMNLVLENEDSVARSVAGLSNIVEALAPVPGRKTVLLLSAGIPTSDRGLHSSDQSVAVGQAAARANVSVYTLFVDRGLNEMNLAETSEPPYTLTNLGRDSMMAERWLDMFSGTAGGAFIRVIGKNPEQAFHQVLTETSAYYLLGIESDRADRDGRPHAFSVKLKQGGSTVRARKWVVVPTPETAASSSAPARGPAATPAVPAGRAARDAIERAYGRGDYAASRQELGALKNLSKWIADLGSGGPLWPENPRREAVFVLEIGGAALGGPIESARVEAARLLMQYSSRLPRSEGSDQFECAWYWGALAAFEGSESPAAGVPLSERAAVRCPAVGQVLLARAILMDRASPVLVKTGADGVPAVVLPVPARANEIVLAYRAAMRSPAQETEARARLGLLLLRLRRFDEVLAILGDHPAHTSDPPLQYVTDFVRGQAFRAKAEFQLAEASYRAAMSDVPGAQSAPVALMTMLATGGRAQDAETLAEAIKDVPQAADPWAAFWYGDHVVLPAVIDSLRRGIQ